TAAARRPRAAAGEPPAFMDTRRADRGAGCRLGAAVRRMHANTPRQWRHGAGRDSCAAGAGRRGGAQYGVSPGIGRLLPHAGIFAQFHAAVEIGELAAAFGPEGAAGGRQVADAVDAEGAEIVAHLAPCHQRPDLAPEPQAERTD